MDEDIVLYPSVMDGKFIRELVSSNALAESKKVTLDFIWSEDAIEETVKKLHSKSFYFNEEGKIVFSRATLVNDIMSKQMTE